MRFQQFRSLGLPAFTTRTLSKACLLLAMVAIQVFGLAQSVNLSSVLGNKALLVIDGGKPHPVVIIGLNARANEGETHRADANADGRFATPASINSRGVQFMVDQAGLA